MKIAGMETQLLKAYQQAQQSLNNAGNNNRAQTTTMSDKTSYYSEAFHVDITLKDGSSMSLDYLYEAMERKTEHEFVSYADQSYNNDYWSSENTAGRIIDFAKSLWDGTPEQLNTLSKAIKQGISEAKDVLGAMPEWLNNTISSTEDLIMKGLEEMEKQLADTPVSA
ncbi:MAG: DUF5610 domain-containing protein [Thermodesulfobacteriota bacterium]|nr:DUF5610 domain-containing protein [Thermodesulfobacteriota bacterium]